MFDLKFKTCQDNRSATKVWVLLYKARARHCPSNNAPGNEPHVLEDKREGTWKFIMFSYFLFLATHMEICPSSMYFQDR